MYSFGQTEQENEKGTVPEKLLDKSIFRKGQLEELLSQFSKQLTAKKDEFLASIEEAEEHKERLQKEINTMEVIQAQWGKVVFLNVGGRHFDVSLSTHPTLKASGSRSMNTRSSLASFTTSCL